MKKWTKIAGGGAVGVLVVAAAVWSCSATREPVYKGNGVREYVYRAAWGGWPNPEVEKALIFFGTNSVPYVRAGLRAKDHWDRRVLAWFAAKVPQLKIRVRKANMEHDTALRAYCWIVTSGSWGDATWTCEPEVRDLMNDPDSNVRWNASQLLIMLESRKWDGPILR
jgi:hypothetical protein